jgi:RNA polymerase sigma factor (sigma-70 family)
MSEPETQSNSKTERSLLNRQEDYKLVERAKLNEQAAFARLMEKYQKPLYFHINKIVHDKEILEDLIQEIFLKAFDNIHSFDASYAFSTWLYRIATNHSIDYLRKRKLKTLSIDEPYQTKDGELRIELADDDSEADDVILHQQRVNIIMEAIESLPDKYERIIRLRHMEEKSYQEIAEIMELPLGTVKAHIFRARELLNKYLKDKRGSF